ncbi:hypothetical protein AAG906_036907 [Vitis piasezkii]
MKLNPTRCAFGVGAGKFLGFMVTQRGIEVNLTQIKIVLKTPTPTALGRFIAHFMDKLGPFFLTLREASTLKFDEQLYMYLAVSDYVNGVDSSNPKECCSEALPILLGSSSDRTHKPATPSLILQSPTGELMEQAIRLNFSISNSEVEYEAILAGLDLPLVLIETSWNYEQVSCEENGKANTLAGIAATLPIKEAVMLPVYLKVAPLITPERVCNISQTNLGWMLNIVKYLRTGEWGMDIVGSLSIAAAQNKFLLIAINYFRKWVEVKAYASIKDKDVSKFVWKNINLYSTSRYPQSNEQVEATNKTLLSALTKILEGAKGKWVDELPGVLWAYRTTSRQPTGATPFALAYGMEPLFQLRLACLLPKQSQLDWADKLRGDKRAQPRFFQLRSLVHRRVFKNISKVGAEKLQYNWEGPYVVTKAGYSGAYHL